MLFGCLPEDVIDIALVIVQEGQDDPVSLVSFRIDKEYDEEESGIEFQGRNSVLGAPVLENPWTLSLVGVGWFVPHPPIKVS